MVKMSMASFATLEPHPLASPPTKRSRKANPKGSNSVLRLEQLLSEKQSPGAGRPGKSRLLTHTISAVGGFKEAGVGLGGSAPPELFGMLEDDDGSSDKDKGGYYDTGKGGSGTGSCGSEVKAGAPCEGDWEETLCQDDRGDYWWCENGTWTSK